MINIDDIVKSISETIKKPLSSEEIDKINAILEGYFMIKIELNSTDLSEIKSSALHTLMSENKPNKLDSSEFLVYCYASAVSSFLSKRGYTVNLTIRKDAEYSATE